MALSYAVVSHFQCLVTVGGSGIPGLCPGLSCYAPSARKTAQNTRHEDCSGLEAPKARYMGARGNAPGTRHDQSG